MNPHTDVCEGCHRTLDEIIKWSMATDSEKIEILEEIRKRNDNLGN